MAKCANCTRDAVYVYQVTSAFKQEYCQKHLPQFLWKKRDEGKLALPVAVPVVELPVIEEPVVEEPVVEEPVVEEPVVEEAPKPSKKKFAPVIEEPVVEVLPEELEDIDTAE